VTAAFTPGQAAADPGTIVLGYNGGIDAFTRSPLRLRSRASAMRWMYSSLLRFDENVQLRGDLAESWERAPDGLSYTFRLRRDALWHDGQPVTAHDVVFTAKLLKQPHRYFRNTLHLHTGEPVEFRALDDHTVRVETPRPYVALPAYLTATWASVFWVVPRHLLADGDEAAFEASPVGSGPFRFGEVRDDGHGTLLAHPRYFGGAPRAERVLMRCFTNNEERRDAFIRGELDLMVAPGREFFAELTNNPAKHDGVAHSVVSNQIIQWGLNCRHPLFSTVRARQAIAHAIDREKLIRDVDGEDGMPAWSPVGPTSWAYEPNVPRPAYDPALSRRMLAEDGWRPGPDGVLERDGARFAFSVVYVPDRWNVDYAGYAAGLQAMLRGVGVALEIRPMEYWNGIKPLWRDHSFESFMYHDTFYNEPDLYWSWHSSMPRRPNGPPEDAPAGLAQYGYGTTGYSNPRVDELVVSAREELDPARRLDQLREAQRILADEVASIWLANFRYRNVTHRRLRGLSKPSLSEGTADLVVTTYPERLRKF
jgi:peptide/nickel transport system substrate-binding protein